MAEIRKPRKRPLGFFDAQDKVIGLRSIYATASSGSEHTRNAANQHHRDLDEVSTPEPDAELEDSELSDNERKAAIERMRARRDGIA